MQRIFVLTLSMLLILLLSTPCLFGSARALENRDLFIAGSETASDEDGYQARDKETYFTAAWEEDDETDENLTAEDNEEDDQSDEEPAYESDDPFDAKPEDPWDDKRDEESAHD